MYWTEKVEHQQSDGWLVPHLAAWRAAVGPRPGDILFYALMPIIKSFSGYFIYYKTHVSKSHRSAQDH